MVKVFPVIIFFILLVSVSLALNTSKRPINRCIHRTHSLNKRLFGTSMKSEKDNVLLDPPTTSSSNNVIPPSLTYSLTYPLTMFFNKNNDNMLVRYGILAMVPVLWGTYTPIVKGLYSSIDPNAAPPPVLFNLFSFIVSFLVLSSTKLKSNNSINEIKINEIKAGAELGLYLFAGSFIQIIGIQQTSATRASILVLTHSLPRPVTHLLTHSLTLFRSN